MVRGRGLNASGKAAADGMPPGSPPRNDMHLRSSSHVRVLGGQGGQGFPVCAPPTSKYIAMSPTTRWSRSASLYRYNIQPVGVYMT